MLVLFNLQWQRFDIERQVTAANRKVNGIAREKGAAHCMVFNLASLGAGERIIDRTERLAKARKKDPDLDAKLLEKGIDPQELTSYATPHRKTLDYIRRRHWRIARDLKNDNNYQAYHDAAEMLTALRARGHQLAAVFAGARESSEQALKRARARDYFEDNVYSADSIKTQKKEPTPMDLYRQAMRMLSDNPEAHAPAETAPSTANLYKYVLKMHKTAAVDSIIVADSAEGIKEGVDLKPMAVAGYLDPYLENKEIDQRLAEMRGAGAHYAVVGGHGISSLPDYLHGTRRLKSQRDLLFTKLGFELK